MTDKDYDELSTKREMVRLLAKDATDEQLDAAIDACLDKRLNDAERRIVLIQSIYGSWYERLTKRPRPPGADFALTWEDVERMFLDVLAMVGAARQPLPLGALPRMDQAQQPRPPGDRAGDADSLEQAPSLNDAPLARLA